MSFNIALSGLKASQKDLDVTANNIANVNTYGFKESRAEFADVFSSSIFSSSKTQNGGGVVTQDVAQQFHQGSLLITSNSLDMAISGNGFFVTTEGPLSRDFTYTRAGAFKLDSENRIVTSDGNFLQGLPVNTDGSVKSVSLSTTAPIQIPDSAGSPSATGQIDLSFNLNSNATNLDPALFDPTDTTTFTSSTSTVVYDSLGNSRIAAVYYVKTTNPAALGASGGAAPGTPGVVGGSADTNNSTWAMFSTVTDDAGNVVNVDLQQDPNVANPGALQYQATSGQRGMLLQFDSSGVAVPGTFPTPRTEPLGTVANVTVPVVIPHDGAGVINNGADPDQTFNMVMTKLTQVSGAFEVSALSQDGKTVGRLTGISIGTDGLIEAKYSNGDTQAISKVALVRFPNDQGLTQIGNTSWTSSQTSGEPLAGEADSGTFGSIRSGTLEQSNVNLTGELVDLITAQRNFQANSRALEVNNSISQTILQIR
ncbi:flagellar hook protein FlgE [Pseudoalteromonas denitrificans]|uniref:Flagellar hook protein FlgE n=1 Tax=Pseudoalteromonas denitrificans DSM 6059 TaxID=1123010 RepID=A0A1I1HMR1_9GAMM|nr:flagellar hook protein FlgE [Pseudoalteromonas denitrificans]SFC25065.1 flagellar hook protein FlgE [Pseudoalteromonas denitrificans DSM 6059]